MIVSDLNRGGANFSLTRSIIVLSLVTLTVPISMAAQQALPPTATGICELKTLPAGMLLKAEGRGNYFKDANGLFRPLFEYISAHNIAMTTPVEAQVENAATYF